MKKSDSIIEKVFKSSLVSLTAAVVVTMLGIVIDGIVIGRFLGPESMAAYTLATPISNLVMALSGLMTEGTQVMCALNLGKGNVKRARNVFSVCMIATLAISAVLVAAILLFTNDISSLLGARGASAGLQPLVGDYLIGLAFSFPATILLFEFNSLMRLDGDSTRVIIAVVTMTVLDIAGDLLNALVIGGGMFGMGLATTISYLVALVIMLLHFRKMDIVFKFSIAGMGFGDLKDILVAGCPSAVGNVATMARNFTLNQIMLATALSTMAVGALGVLTVVQGFVSCVLIGVGMTTGMIAGMILGEQDRSSAEKLVRVAMRTALALGVILAVVVFVFSGGIASLFGGSDGTEMVDLAARGLRFYALSVILYGVNNAFVNYTQGMRRTGLSACFCFLQNFVFIAAVALTFRGILDSDAVWVAFPAGEVLTAIAIVALAAFLKRGLPAGEKDFLFLKEPFGAPPDDVLDVTISNMDEVVDACEAADKFCRARGADEKTCYRMSLFIEELGSNVVEYGFAAEEGKLLEIRIVRLEDGWVLRLRDNCKAFDPFKWIELNQSDDPTVNMGIKLVVGMAKEVTYVSTLDLNMITLRI